MTTEQAAAFINAQTTLASTRPTRRLLHPQQKKSAQNLAAWLFLDQIRSRYYPFRISNLLREQMKDPNKMNRSEMIHTLQETIKNDKRPH